MTPKGVRFASLRCSDGYTCGLVEGNQTTICWGTVHNDQKPPLKIPGKVEGHKFEERTKGRERQEIYHGFSFSSNQFKAVSLSKGDMCGIQVDDTVRCVGYGPLVQNVPKRLKFSTIKVQRKRACGILKGYATNPVECWGTDNEKQGASGVALLGNRLKLQRWKTCSTEHPELAGPTACTSCPDDSTPFHTIIDARRGAGTCTSTECPFCKPRACCDEGHKHYVVNTQSLEGVCVRHSDDCTPVCVPRDDHDAAARRVCTKGCNLLVKASKDRSDISLLGAASKDESMPEAHLFDLVVCQAEKRVVCEGWRPGSTGKQCSQDTKVAPVAVCNFTVGLWGLGGTCIDNHLSGLKFPNCPQGKLAEAIPSITKLCSKASSEEVETNRCMRLAMSF
jgi:hypothetical protein